MVRPRSQFIQFPVTMTCSRSMNGFFLSSYNTSAGRFSSRCMLWRLYKCLFPHTSPLPYANPLSSSVSVTPPVPFSCPGFDKAHSCMDSESTSINFGCSSAVLRLGGSELSVAPLRLLINHTPRNGWCSRNK